MAKKLIRKSKVEREGLSPLMATFLLVIVAAAALSAVFFWTRTVEVERLEKFGAPIEDACLRLSFSASLSSQDILIENSGEVPIYAINMVVVRDEGEKVVFLRPKDGIIDPTEKDSVTASVLDLSGRIESITIVPIIVGESIDEFSTNKLYTCVGQRRQVL